MNKTVIIIPSRLDAIRLPNKPLKLINNKEMILHVYEAAMKANAGEVYVATPDKKIIDIVKKIGGNAILQKDQIGTYEEQQENIRKYMFEDKKERFYWINWIERGRKIKSCKSNDQAIQRI